MESSPISAEAVQILNFVFEEGRRRQNNDVEGKVLRQALAVKTEAITALVPTHLTAFGTPRVDDSYQLTFEGLLASSYVEALKESLKALLRVFIGKYRADP